MTDSTYGWVYTVTSDTASDDYIKQVRRHLLRHAQPAVMLLVHSDPLFSATIRRLYNQSDDVKRVIDQLANEFAVAILKQANLYQPGLSIQANLISETILDDNQQS